MALFGAASGQWAAKAGEFDGGLVGCGGNSKPQLCVCVSVT